MSDNPNTTSTPNKAWATSFTKTVHPPSDFNLSDSDVATVLAQQLSKYFKPEEIIEAQQKYLESGWPEEYIRAAVSHGWGICSDVTPQTDLEKFLYTIDELTGLVVTTALVRPSKSVLDVQVKSVKNKWKDKRFAAGVDRSIIEKGAGMLQVGLDELIDDTIKGMQEVAEAIGLKGNL